MRVALCGLGLVLASSVFGCRSVTSPVAPVARAVDRSPTVAPVIVPPLRADASVEEPKSARSAAREAYERIVAGDQRGARLPYSKAKAALDADMLVDDEPTLRGALGLLRLDAEQQQRTNPENPPDVDCSVFAKHGHDALVAYRAWFASTRDTYAFEVKHQCLDITLAPVPALEATRARTAMDRLVTAMLSAVPVPEGTMYQGMALGAADAIVDVLLAPEAVTTANGDAELAAAVRAHPSMAAAVARFAKLRDADVPLVAGGVCGIFRTRGRAIAPADCEEIARNAANHAMADWIDATSDSP